MTARIEQRELGYFETNAVLRCVGCGVHVKRGLFVETMYLPKQQNVQTGETYYLEGERRVAFFCSRCQSSVGGGF